MKCPHCLDSFHPQPTWSPLGNDVDSPEWSIARLICPACQKQVLFLHRRESVHTNVTTHRMVYPKAFARTPLRPAVKDPYASDYKEACLVLADSPKASAALSRRCLQNILREFAKVKPSDLSKEIDEVLASKALPTYLAEGVDAVRTIGNFAAHPIKSTHTGDIVDVEPGEAEWLLDVVEGLFDFYIIQPDVLQAKRRALNKKLAEAGKPPLK